jgi:hypothetical protein
MSLYELEIIDFREVPADTNTDFRPTVWYNPRTQWTYRMVVRVSGRVFDMTFTNPPKNTRSGMRKDLEKCKKQGTVGVFNLEDPVNIKQYPGLCEFFRESMLYSGFFSIENMVAMYPKGKIKEVPSYKTGGFGSNIEYYTHPSFRSPTTLVQINGRDAAGKSSFQLRYVSPEQTEILKQTVINYEKEPYLSEVHDKLESVGVKLDRNQDLATIRRGWFGGHSPDLSTSIWLIIIVIVVIAIICFMALHMGVDLLLPSAEASAPAAFAG